MKRTFSRLSLKTQTTFVFSLVAILIIVLCGILVPVFATEYFKQQTINSLNEQNVRIKKYIIDGEIDKIENDPISFQGMLAIVEIAKESEVENKVLFSSIPMMDIQDISSINEIVESAKEIRPAENINSYEYGQVKCATFVQLEGQEFVVYSSMALGLNESLSPLIITIIGVGINLLVFVLLILFLYFKIIKPITKISDKAKELSLGNLDVKFDEGGFKEARELSNTLNHAVSEIKRSKEIQSEVIQNVSHEFNTPLTIIRAYTELLEDYTLTNKDKSKQHLKIIKEKTDVLQKLINDMIKLSSLKNNVETFDFEEVSISKMLQKLEEFYRKKFEKLGYHFQFSILKNCKIVADSEKLERVITNFIDNAIKYSNNLKEIKVELFKNSEGKLELKVSDKGCGVKPELQAKIFERYFRCEPAETKGSGIGLAISKEILIRHNFKFGVESDGVNGSTFYIIF